MPKKPPRHKRGEADGEAVETTGFLSLSDISRLLDIPLSTLALWRDSGRMPDPDVPHHHSPLWHARSITQWSVSLDLSPAARRKVESLRVCPLQAGVASAMLHRVMKQGDDIPRYVTAGTLAQRLGVDRTTVVNRVHAGIYQPSAIIEPKGWLLFTPEEADRIVSEARDRVDK